MARSRTTTLVLVLFVTPLVALVASACGTGGAERPLIRSYFLASRLNDRPTLNNIAMVRFEDATVSTFTIDNVSEPQSRPLRFKELNQALMDARQADDAFTTEKVAYQDDNFDAINRVLAAERDEEDVASRDAEVQEAWTDWRNRTMAQARMVSDAQVELSNEQTEVELSMYDPNNPLDFTQYDGELWTKDVSITANVERGGTESEEMMVITLQWAVLVGSDGVEIEGGEVIARIN